MKNARAGEKGRTTPEAGRGLLLGEIVLIETRLLRRIALLQSRLSSQRSGAGPQTRQNHKSGHGATREKKS